MILLIHIITFLCWRGFEEKDINSLEFFYKMYDIITLISVCSLIISIIALIVSIFTLIILYQKYKIYLNQNTISKDYTNQIFGKKAK